MPGRAQPTKVGGVTWLRIALLVAAGLWVYWPALHGNWLWDDNQTVTGNAALHSPAGLVKIWTTTPDWALTSTLFWIEWHLWGKVPYGYHAVTFALHLTGGLLVWRLLARLGLRRAWLGGMLFVIHPLAVESVAWISETKNTLSLPLALLSLDAWLDRDQGRSRWSYARSLLFYLAAMLAKTSVIMLPAVLLLYAWWKRGTVARREVMATLPFFAVALILGAVTLYFQHASDAVALEVHITPIWERIVGAPVALLFYLGKFILPVGLLAVYPAWAMDGNLWIELAVPVLALGLGGWWAWRQGRTRAALFGLGFFVLNLLPVLGLVHMLYFDISPVADHFVYLPMIGLIGLAVAALEQIQLSLKPKPLLYSVILVWLGMLGLAAVSRGYAGLYLNHQTLWSYTLARNQKAWPGHNNMGDVYLATGRLADAQREYETTLKLNPDYAGAHSNLGTVLLETGHGVAAVQEYREAVRLAPGTALYHFNLGIGLAQTGQGAEAIAEYEGALKLDPDNARVHNNLANALIQAGRLDEAIAECQAALQLDPAMGPAHANLGDAYMHAGRSEAAIGEYVEALKTEPNMAYVHYNLANALVRTGRTDDAIEQYGEAIRLGPKSAATWSNLGVALARAGRLAEATAALEQAVKLDPGMTEARKNLEQLRLIQPPASK